MSVGVEDKRGRRELYGRWTYTGIEISRPFFVHIIGNNDSNDHVNCSATRILRK